MCTFSWAIPWFFPLIFVLFPPPPQKKKKVVEVFDAGEGALRFTFHTPFTAAGKVHGSTAEQCKKLTELEVRRKEKGGGGAANFRRRTSFFVLLRSRLCMPLCLIFLLFYSYRLFCGDGRITWCLNGRAPLRQQLHG